MPVSAMSPLLQPADRLLRKPLAAWWAGSLQNFQRQLHNGPVTELAAPLNQMALVLAFHGMPQHSARLCQAQIRLWQSAAAREHQSQWQALAVQPWINLARLQRWDAQQDCAAMYQEFAPQARSGGGSLQEEYGVTCSLLQLQEYQADVGDLLDMVYWRELGQEYYRQGDYARLQKHVAQGLRSSASPHVKLYLLELLALQQAANGQQQAAVRFLQKFQADAAAPIRLALQGHVVALQRRLDAAAAEALTRAWLQELHAQRWENGAGLNFLHSVCQLLAGFGCAELEREWLQITLRQAQALRDEMVEFALSQRMAQLGMLERDEIRVKFTACAYAQVRRQLDLPALPARLIQAQTEDVLLALDALCAGQLAQAQQRLAA